MMVASIWSGFLNGLGGTVHGSFFRVEDTVDVEKPPGATSLIKQRGSETPYQVCIRILNGTAFFYSPNLTWFVLAGLLWVVFPYKLDPTIDWKVNLWERLWINHVIILGYAGFWHSTLHILHWAHRPFVPHRPYNRTKVLHNIFFTSLGSIQWTFTEAAFLHCYRTHKLKLYDHPDRDHDFLWQLILWSLAVPVIRDIHFYFSHRLIHTRFLYTFIHAVHHRNTDIEPFSGLCMHPCEHLYYFTCYAPLLFLPHHPFILFWMGMHTVLSPAASHSGYEDHFSNDLYHYIHHRYFECNYAGGIPFDRWFGTYRDTLQQNKNKTTKDSSIQHTTTTTINDIKATLWGWPDHVLYQCLAVVLPIVLFMSLLLCKAYPDHMFSNSFVLSGVPRHGVAFFLATLPISAAALLYRGKNPPPGTFLAPFIHTDSTMSFLFHMTGGFLSGVLPAYYLLALVLA